MVRFTRCQSPRVSPCCKLSPLVPGMKPSTSMDSEKRTPSRKLQTVAWMTALAAVVAVGCSSEPQAPVLRNEPVYENDTEGFRFLTPEGWRQHAKVNVPPGKLEKERLLVQYVGLSSEKGASLDVSMADLPATTDLTAYLAGPSGGLKAWRLKPPVEQIRVGGVSAQRFTFVGRIGKEDTTKE